MKNGVVGRVEFEDLWRFFNEMRANWAEKIESKVYITKASMKRGLRKYFGHKVEFLEARLFDAIQGNSCQSRIYIE